MYVCVCIYIHTHTHLCVNMYIHLYVVNMYITGNTPAHTGCAESLAVADKEEAWILHVLPDDTQTSAIWAAAR